MEEHTQFKSLLSLTPDSDYMTLKVGGSLIYMTNYVTA